ncbi:MAG: plastocyanin/azurin family copper-binding protein [Ktedonobacteraceae bacterium]
MLKKLFAILGLSCIVTLLLVACSNASNASVGPNPVHMNATNFVQNSITIKKGESITLIDDDLFGSHTIANGAWENGTAQPAREAGAPEINDVKIGGNSSAAIGPFTTPGTFKLYCTVHAGMNLTVTVQ